MKRRESRGWLAHPANGNPIVIDLIVTSNREVSIMTRAKREGPMTAAEHRLGMTVSSMRTDRRTGAWTVVALLFLFTVVNFADKAVIGIAAVPIMRELQLETVIPRRCSAAVIGSSTNSRNDIDSFVSSH